MHGRKPRLAHLTWLLGLILVFLLGNGGRDLAAGVQTPPPQAKPAPAPPGAKTAPASTTGQRPGGPGQRAPFTPWWADAAIQKEVGLSAKQITDLQKIWDATLPGLKSKNDEADKEKKELDKLIIEGAGEEALVKLHINRLEAYRSQANTDRLFMDWKMHRLLTTEQNLKLKAIWDRQRAARDGRGGNPLRESRKHD